VTAGQRGARRLVRPVVLGSRTSQRDLLRGRRGVTSSVTVLLWPSIAPRSAASFLAIRGTSSARASSAIRRITTNYSLTASATITVASFHASPPSADRSRWRFSLCVRYRAACAISAGAPGALFYLFRDSVDLDAELAVVFGLLLSVSSVFSPTGLSASPRGFIAVPQKREIEASAGCRPARSCRMRHCRPCWLTAGAGRPVLIARELAKSFGGIRACVNADISCPLARCMR